MRIVPVALLALALEIGWLALWPLSGALSHSPLFNAEFMASHPSAARLFALSLRAAHAFLPGLSETPISESLGSSTYQAPAAALVAVMLFLAAAYLGSLVVLDRGVGARRAAMWIVLGGAVVFQTTLLFMPGLFSQDVFSYIAYGRLAAVYDLNPYVWPPSAISKDVSVAWVAEVWRTYAAPYGPLWLDVQWLMARLSGDLSMADQAFSYRLLANALLLGNLGLAWATLGTVTPLGRAERTAALAALAWNPLLLFEVAGNAHNDVLMVSFSLLAVLLYVRSSSDVLAGASFTLSVLVKYLSGLGLVWVALASAARVPARKKALLRLVLLGTVSATITLAVMAPWLELPDSLDPIAIETAGVDFVNALPDDAAIGVADHVFVRFGLAQDLARQDARRFERLLVLATFGVYLVWEARRVVLEPNPAAVVRASARSCLVYLLVVSQSVQPWYFGLPVALGILSGWRATHTRVIIGYSLLALPALYLSYYLRNSMPAWVNVLYGLVPLAPVLVGWLVPRARGALRQTRAVARTVG